jgi:allantoin racemase
MGTSSTEVRIVTPVVGAPFPEELAALGGTRFDITQVGIERGPSSLESEFEESMSVPETLEKIVEAPLDGVGAVVIDCTRDPGLGAARELVSTPVIGPAEATMHLASMLAHRFSVVTVPEKLVPAFENQAKVYGVADKLASVRSVEIPVLELERDPERLLRALVDEPVEAITDDGAHAIVFGCTGMFGYAKRVEDALGELGYEGVPVLDPIPTAVRLAQVVIELGLTHSKRTYPLPAGAWAEQHAFVGTPAARTSAK